jgi:hypothetical protein
MLPAQILGPPPNAWNVPGLAGSCIRIFVHLFLDSHYFM